MAAKVSWKQKYTSSEMLTSTLNVAAAELAILRKENSTAKRDEFLRAAVAEGKITPGDKELWASLYDANQDHATKLMADRPKQSATPVGAKLQSREPAPAPAQEPVVENNRPARLFGIDPTKAAAIQKELDS